MGSRCPNCGVTFERKKKGFRRSKVGVKFTPNTVKALFPSLEKDSFICDNCCEEQKKLTVPVKGSRKRKLLFAEDIGAGVNVNRAPLKKRLDVKNTPVKVLSDVSRRKHKSKDYFKSCKYKEGFRALLKERPRAKEAFVSVAVELLKKEFRQFSKSVRNSVFSQTISPASLSSFSWGQLIEEAVKTLPVAVQFLRAFFPKEKDFLHGIAKGPRRNKRPMTETEARDIIASRMGLMLSVALYTRSCKRNKFVQSCIGVEMWRQQCSEKMFQIFSSFGVCQSSGTARLHVDVLAGHHADEIKAWKRDVENYVQKSRSEFAETPEVPKGYAVGCDSVQISDAQNLEQKNKLP